MPYIHALDPFLLRIGDGFGIRWYGVSYALSFVLGWLLYRTVCRRKLTEVKEEDSADFITLMAIFGVMLGGRLGWILLYGWRQILADPFSALKVWEGGMASHGGIMGIFFFTLWYARKKGISWVSIGDGICPVAPIGLFLVRCANFINGELWGKPASVPWAVVFPTELAVNDRPPLDAIRHDPIVRERLVELLPARHPSQIYEALLEGVLLFAVLWFLRTRMHVARGVVTGTFFILYAVLRCIGETFRVPDWTVAGLSAGQLYSLPLVVIGVSFIAWSRRTRIYEAGLPVQP